MATITVHTILPGRIYQRGHLLKKSYDAKVAFLADNDIRLVVGLARAKDCDLAALLTNNYIWYPIPDGALDETVDIIGFSEELVSKHRALGGAVLVYCNAGRNRSSLVSALMLRLITGCSGAEAVVKLRAARPNALANPAFVAFLETLPALTPTADNWQDSLGPLFHLTS